MDIVSKEPDSLGNRGKTLFPKDIHRNSPEDTKVNQSRTTTQRRFILFEDNIFDPMKAILNMPAWCASMVGEPQHASVLEFAGQTQQHFRLES
jgi:hypothetical protein